MTGQANAPVIIKRKKVIAGGGHHGGAWKVAYADFVTAMMAFFLLMWLLNATTEKQRKGLSDYFNPSIAVNRVSGGGDSTLNGDSMFTQDTKARSGSGGLADDRGSTAGANDAAGQGLAGPRLEEVEQALLERGGESRTMEQLLRHVITRVTDEGLVIELYDLPEASLFIGDTAEPQPVTVALAGLLAEVMALTANPVAVNGHVRRHSGPLAQNPGWDLTAARAQVMRGLLETQGLGLDRMQRIGGFADRKPVAAEPTALRNNRLEIILLRVDR